MIEVDGSLGEGGGQILRTCAAMGALTGEEFRIENIRAKRKNPGLRPQHITAIDAVARLCDAKVEGLHEGSMTLEFKPGKIKGGSMRLNIGTAGSITLVLQALMVPAMYAEKDVDLEITGGTDVRWSPQIDFLRFVTLPLLSRFGYAAEINLVKRGYYPAGGGIVKARIKPAGGLDRINLLERGEIISIGGMSHASQELSKAEVAERQAKSAGKLVYEKLSAEARIKKEYANTVSYGSGITLWANTEKSVVGADSLGEKGKPSESVGLEAAERFIEEISSGAALDSHMGDQIIPYLALAGGKVDVSRITEHTRTNVEIVNRFGFEVRIKDRTIRA